MSTLPRAVKVYGPNSTLKAVMVVLGLIFLGTAAGLWISLAPQARTRLERVMTGGLTAFMFVGGAGLLCLRKQCAADPASRLVENRWTFAGVAVRRASRSFAEFSSVRFDIMSGAGSAPALRLILIPRDGGSPFLVTAYIGLDAVPPEALADAQELAALLDLPLDRDVARAA